MSESEFRLSKYVAQNKFISGTEYLYREFENVSFIDQNIYDFNSFCKLNQKLGICLADCYANNHFFVRYVDPVIHYLKALKLDCCVPVLIGDTSYLDFALPILGKARKIGSPNITLLRLNELRHWGHEFRRGLADPYDSINKAYTCVWRGTTTGSWYEHSNNNSRYLLFKAFCDYPDKHLNFGLSSYTPSTEIRVSDIDKQKIRQWVKGELTIQQMLESLFILALEGNDVSSSLKWILASKSVPLMKAPRFESWAMESSLIADYHYLEVRQDNFGDLLEVIYNATLNLDSTHAIAENGRLFINQFLDSEKEFDLNTAVIRNFLY